MTLGRFRIVESDERDEALLKPAVDELAPNDIADFQEACHKLLATGRNSLIIDLRGFRAVPSVIIGAVLDAHELAAGRKVLLKAEGWAADIFRTLLGRLMDIVESDDPAE